ncbi:MAG: DHA2 family efflux MFS transporter permease subunit [Acidobacteriia bacterium]|nr:DHA2 family efflux MFS transporter permease subunit [Terriglobia bacterium]
MDRIPEVAPPYVNPWLVSLSVMMGTFMVVLDTTVVNVSLPHIAGSLSASIEESTWALTSYLAANAVILPLTGWLANHFGRKRLLMISVVGFTTASFLCGLAVNLPMLIVCRIVQGMTGGVMQPISQAIMLEAFAPRERGKAMAFFGVGIVVAPILGPVLGGWLTDTYSWRWIFYINIPFGALSLFMTSSFIFDPRYIRRGTARIDYWGIGLLAVGIGALQIGLDKGQQEDWFSSNWITALLVTAVMVLPLLVIRELRVRNPVIDLHVFRERTYSTGVVLMTLMGFVLYGSLVLLPILLQTLMGYPPLEAGIAMAPRGVGSLLAMPLVGIMMARIDPRKLLMVGYMVGGFSLFWFARISLEAGYWNIFWPQLVQGIGLGLLFVPLATVTMDRIPKEKMGNATSLFNLMRNIGGSTGIAVIGTILTRQQQVHTNVLGARINPYDMDSQIMVQRMKTMFLGQGADAVTATKRTYAALFGMTQQQAGILSFNDAFRLLGLIFVLLTPLVLLMRRPGTGHHPPPAPPD